MVKFRQVTPEEEAFVNAAKTSDGAGRGRVVQPTLAPVAPPPIPPELSPRVQKQVNIVMPETSHYELRELVKTMPDMSMQRFILEAISEKMARVRAGLVA